MSIWDINCFDFFFLSQRLTNSENQKNLNLVLRLKLKIDLKLRFQLNWRKKIETEKNMRTKKNNQNSKNQFKNRTEFCCQTKKRNPNSGQFFWTKNSIYLKYILRLEIEEKKNN